MESSDNIKFKFQLSNKSRSANIFILYIISGVVFAGAGFYFLATSMNVLLLAIIVLAIAYFMIFNKLKPFFVELLVTDTELQFNYYSVASTMRSYQSIEFPLEQLAGYELKKSFFGLRKMLTISVTSKYGIADYPPISVTLMNKKELSQIFRVLKEIINSSK
jgi:hypothetical protein